MTAYTRIRPFPGILYAGDGMRLAGDGPDAFTDAQGEALPFKAVIHGTPPRPGAGSEMKMGDRIWVLPDSLGSPPEIPPQLLLELVGIIKQGGQVGLAARDGAAGAKMRDMLVLLLSPPEGRA
ncbi:MAG: hypothetical protein ACRYHQ_34275 [Janthinobacterium lividum]